MLINVFREGFQYPPAFAPFAHLIAPGFFIDVGHRCNFRCLFCSVPRQRRFFPTEQVLDQVRLAGQHGLGQGFFTGGEPMLSPDLEQIMACGSRHGVSHYGVSTNGWGLDDARRVAELARLGMTVWKLSWDDHRPEVLDRLRGHRGVTEVMMRALENLHRAPGGIVGVYQVLVADNHDQLPRMVEYLADLRRDFPKLTFLVAALVKPVEDALRNPEVLFDPGQAVPHIRQAMELAEARSFPLAFNNLPACLVPDRPGYHSSTWEHLGVHDTETRQVGPMRFEFARLIRTSECLRCTCFETCNGFFRENAERFGDHIYRPTGALLRPEPLPAELLKAPTETATETPTAEAATQDVPDDSPPAARVVVEPSPEPPPDWLTRGVAGALPPRWRLGGGRLHGAAKRLELELAHDTQGPPLSVMVAPSPPEGPAYATTECLRIWYQGSDLSPAQQQALEAAVAFCRRHDQRIHALLDNSL